ncbi:hypothetical protein [Rhizobium leguminosarum]|uniref:hypothetical protein n=1 Tax=Rhizobium leguminosarum TaxID=384 RepID=UPI00040E3EDF|nr:hypothetical protein [Rhizobium leguminosarum]
MENCKIGEDYHQGLLQWVADGSGAVSEISDLHPSAITFLEEQRLVGRALQRVLFDPQLHETPTAAELSKIFCRELLARQTQTEAAVATLAAHSASLGEALLVKGPALYMNTLNPFHARRSGDVDILLEEPAKARYLARQEGLEEYKVPMPHEEINLLLEGRRYDFHKGFPIWRRSGKSLHQSEAGQERVYYSSQVSIDYVAHDDLQAGAKVISNRNGMNVCIPDSAASAFIQIIHFYRDLVRLFVGWTFARYRISAQELLDIRDLIRSNTFSAERFRQLIDKYDIAEQAQICGSIMYAITGDRVLLDVTGSTLLFERDGGRASLELNLWYGFSLWFEVDLDALSVRPFSLETAVPLIAANKIDDDRACSISLRDPTSKFHINGKVSEFDLKVSFQEDVSLEFVYSASDDDVTGLKGLFFIGEDAFQIDFEAPADSRVSTRPGNRVLSFQTHRQGALYRGELKLSTGEQRHTRASVAAFAMGKVTGEGSMQHGVFTALTA